MDSREEDDRTTDGAVGLDLNAVFDPRDTLFTRAAESLADILAHPPMGPNAFDLLSGGIDELSNLMIRSLPLRTVREARLAQGVQTSQVLDDGKSLVLAQAVSTFLDRLQVAAAEQTGTGDAGPLRPIPDLALIRLEQALRAVTAAADAADRQRLLETMAGTQAQTIDGVLAKLRTLRFLLGSAGPLSDRSGMAARLLSGAIETLERIAVARAAAQCDSAMERLTATAPPKDPITAPPFAWDAGWRGLERRPSLRPRGFSEDAEPDPDAVRVAVQRLPLGTVLDWQQAVVGLWQRHPMFGPDFHRELKAMGLLSRCVILGARDGGPLCFRYIGGPTRRIFGERWAAEHLGKPHLEDVHAVYAQAIDAQYREAIEGGTPVYNFLTITGLPRPPVNYRHLLFGWSLGDRRQVLLSLIDA